MTSTSSVPESRRAARWAARDTLQEFSTLPRVRGCGKYMREGVHGVGVRVATSPDGSRTAGFAGLQTCGSVWSCPVCSAKIAAGRKAELTRGLMEWVRRGGSAFMVTLTMRHEAGQALSELWDGVSAAWAAARSGRGWRAMCAEYGTLSDRVISRGARAGEIVTEWRIPFVRAVEATHGPNGWHVHVHAVLLLRAGVTKAEAELIRADMFSRWAKTLKRRGFGTALDKLSDVRQMREKSESGVAGYLNKALFGGLAAEVARGDIKTARGRNRTPMQVLATIHNAVEAGEVPAASDLAVWREWEAGSYGRRQLQWSSGLAVDLGVRVAEDQELADAELQGAVVATIPGFVWRTIVAARGRGAVLEAFRRSDFDGLLLLNLVIRYGARGFSIAGYDLSG